MRSRSLKNVPRRSLVATLVCIMALIYLRSFVLQQSIITSGSMEDTILSGDRVLVNNFIYGSSNFGWERQLLPLRQVERGDIVVFRQAQDPGRDFFKRVLGLPGDRIALRRGTLFVNGRKLAEPYVNRRYRRGQDFGPVRVSAGHYFVLGDHRNRSTDSRAWGLVPAQAIRGRASLVLFSARGPSSNTAAGQPMSPRTLARDWVDLRLRARRERLLSWIH